MKKVMLTVLLAFVAVSMFAQVPVTFQVKMNAQMYKKMFDKTKDSVCVRGDFQADAGDAGGNWQGWKFKMSDPNADSIYTLTVNFPSNRVDSTYQFKFVLTGDAWESSPNRTFKLKGPSMVLPAYWENDDSTYKNTTIVTNTIKFTTDLSYMWGSGIGSFDPSQDSMVVMGFNWTAGSTYISGNRTMKAANPLTPKILSATISFSGNLGDSTEWKFKAYPDANFANSGWESGGNQWAVFIKDGSSWAITYTPRIDPIGANLKIPSTYYFQCDTKGAVNRYNNKAIDITKIDFVGLRGGMNYVGSWSSGGNWAVSDTTGSSTSDTTAYMRVLRDDGKNGDLVAKDNKWTIKIVFPVGVAGGAIEYKFAAHYPGADTVNASSSAMDNEGGFGQNHKFQLKDATAPVWINMGFGNFTTEVRQVEGVSLPKNFELSQNYPNPFNPSTVIKYSVPESGMVSLKIYNLLGEEVSELLNQNQNAGTYTATFDARLLSSGVYFYTLKAGSYTSTKKMMLIK